MNDSSQAGKKDLKTDLSEPIDISIPLRFDGEQPRVYGVPPASSKPCEFGEFLGDTRRGGSVNFEHYNFIPHCNGTHTECVGHITEERISVRKCLEDVFTDALLVSIAPEKASDSDENYPYDFEAGDEFVTRKGLMEVFNSSDPVSATVKEARSKDHSPMSLIVRSLPNDDSKLSRSYDRPVPPFFSNEAVEFIVESGFRHLLVDLPSIDRLYDDGLLSNHRLFWNVLPGSQSLQEGSRIRSTVTELIYVPNEIEDGRFLLNLQIAAFETDAVPSRPVLFRR